jgi:hypothetical protein
MAAPAHSGAKPAVQFPVTMTELPAALLICLHCVIAHLKIAARRVIQIVACRVMPSETVMRGNSVAGRAGDCKIRRLGPERARRASATEAIEFQDTCGPIHFPRRFT